MAIEYWVKVSTITTGAAAVFSGVVAFLALVLEPARRWWRRPRLEIYAQPKRPDCAQVWQRAVDELGRPTGTGRFAFYFRMRVKNSPGKDAARHVEAYAEKLDEWKNETWENVPDFPLINLRWSYTDRHEPLTQTYLPLLMSDTEKYCDVAHIGQPIDLPLGAHAAPGTLPTMTPFQLEFDVVEPPSVSTNAVPKGTYRLQVQIAAENAKPIRRWVVISTDGVWLDDEQTMLKEHLEIHVQKSSFDPPRVKKGKA